MAIGVFAAAFSILIVTAVQFSHEAAPASYAEVSAAGTVLAQRVFDPGVGWYSAPPCLSNGSVDASVFTPDGVGRVDGEGRPLGRLGLADEDCSHAFEYGSANLSLDKFANLYLAQRPRDADNGHVDYEEARASLGLTQARIDFHLRSWPVFASTEEGMRARAKEPHLRVLYLADFESLSLSQGDKNRLVQHSKGLVDGPDSVLVWVRVTNNGTTPTVFAIDLTIPLSKSAIDLTRHTNLLDPGASQNVTWTLRKSKDWVWREPAASSIQYEISDRRGGLGDGTIGFATVSMTYATNRPNVFVSADQPTFQLKDSSSKTRVRYHAYDGTGKDATFTDWTYRLEKTSGAVVGTFVLANGAKGDREVLVSEAGAYRARLFNDALSTTWGEDAVNVVTGEPAAFSPIPPSTLVPSEAALEEVRFLGAILDQFSPHVYAPAYASQALSYEAGGDVVPDDKSALKEDLTGLLTDDQGRPSTARYTTLVVGSSVDQQALNPATVKDMIRDWENAGGTLIVLGSLEQRANWLEPIFKTRLESAGGPISVPDVAHPVLNAPNALDYEAYVSDSSWQYNGDEQDGFTHVVQAGDGDALALSNPGAFGEGKVLLTGWRPSSLTPDQATTCPDPLDPDIACQGLFLLANLLAQSYRELFLDYGPPAPTNAAISSTLRIASVWHPQLGEHLPVMVQVLAFGGA